MLPKKPIYKLTNNFKSIAVHSYFLGRLHKDVDMIHVGIFKERVEDRKKYQGTRIKCFTK